MNYADMKLGTWYPMGGMHEIVKAMTQLAEEKGVKIKLNQTVTGFNYHQNSINEVITQEGDFPCDTVVGGADYHHLETLLGEKRNYSEEYWNSRTMAPSSLLFYLGVDKKVKNLLHHNLFFDEDFHQHAVEIYKKPDWPSKPLFYVCCPSKTDPSVAPEGKENIFILIPLAPGLNNDTEEKRQEYFNLVMGRLEKLTGEEIRNHIIYKRSYAHRDFISDYNAFKGNAYGLANTLKQTAILKPSLINKNIKNLYYTGQLTVPGPGVPPSLISGKVVSEEIFSTF
jgi:phytoene desaturase